MITKMTTMETDSKISMMMTKKIIIINNYYDNVQHNHDEANSSDTNEDVARISNSPVRKTCAGVTPSGRHLRPLPPRPPLRHHRHHRRPGRHRRIPFCKL